MTITLFVWSCEVQSSNQPNLPSPKLPRSGNFLSELKFYFPGKNSQHRACLSLFVGPSSVLIVSGLTTKLKQVKYIQILQILAKQGQVTPLASLFCPHYENHHHHHHHHRYHKSTKVTATVRHNQFGQIAVILIDCDVCKQLLRSQLDRRRGTKGNQNPTICNTQLATTIGQKLESAS